MSGKKIGVPQREDVLALVESHTALGGITPEKIKMILEKDNKYVFEIPTIRSQLNNLFANHICWEDENEHWKLGKKPKILDPEGMSTMNRLRSEAERA